MVGCGLSANVSDAVDCNDGGATGADDAIADFAWTPGCFGFSGLFLEGLKEVAVFCLLRVHHLSDHSRIAPKD
jgi:hypothetical protein